MGRNARRSRRWCAGWTCGAASSDETLADALETPVKALIDAADALGDTRDATRWEHRNQRGTPLKLCIRVGALFPHGPEGNGLKLLVKIA